MTEQNNKQVQYIFNTITEIKPEYGQPGTVAFAVLATLLSTGEKGIHIKSIEGIHIGARSARSKNHFSRALGYIRKINTILQQEIGERAPQLTMDMLGTQRIVWKLYTEQAMDDAVRELAADEENSAEESTEDIHPDGDDQ